MPLTTLAPIRNPETLGEFWHGERTLNANLALDPLGVLRAEAYARVQNRLATQSAETKRPDPMTDVLGAARLFIAAQESGMPAQALEKNLWHETKTGIMEALEAEGYVSRTTMAVDQNGRTHVGSVYMDELILRGIHPGWSEVLNEFGEIDLHLELLGQAMYKDPVLRANYHLVQASLLPTDRYNNEQELRDYGFRPDTQKWVLDELAFEHSTCGWQRVGDRLFMSGSDLEIANELLQEEGVSRGEKLSTTDIRRRVLLVPKQRFPQGAAVGFAKRIDQKKAAKYSKAFFCGKERNAPPDENEYAQLLPESRRREQEVELQVEVLARIAADLAANKTLSFEQQNQAYSNAFIHALRAICAKRPEYAVHAFGLKAAWLYQSAKQKAEAGDKAGSDRDLSNAFHESTTVDICNLRVSIEDSAESPPLSIYASLEDKYPGQVKEGMCISCGKEDVKVGPCGRKVKSLKGDGICNPCEIANAWDDTYIARRIKQRNQPHLFGKALWQLMRAKKSRPNAPAKRKSPSEYAEFLRSRKKR